MFRLQFGNLFGISPQAPSASPTAPPGPKARGSKVAFPPKGTRARDPQGNIHVSDGTAQLPPNWTVIK